MQCALGGKDETMRYSFGPFQFDPVRRQLWRNGALVVTTPKALELLQVLLEQPGQVVEKDAILSRLWPAIYAEDSLLSVNMSTLRKALGDTAQEHTYILTFPGRGYKFISQVYVVSADPPANDTFPLPKESSTNSATLPPANGALRPDSRFYVERPTDHELLSALERRDSIILIKGTRQAGKTSLLARGLQHARTQGAQVILTDLQMLSASYFESVENFFQMLAELIAVELELDAHPSQTWNPLIGPSSNFERFWRREILAKTAEPVVWGLDEVDRLFTCSFGNEVFGLFRSWHNKRALEPTSPWQRLTLTMAYATEAHLFITDLNQSPFNVGTRLQLEDFNQAQIRDLNQHYGSPLKTEEELEQFRQLLNGHPYLSNVGLWEISTHGLTLADLQAQANQEDGVFGEHLRRLLFVLRKDMQMTDAVRGLLQGHPCQDAEMFYRLRTAGVISGHSAREAAIRCQLYQIYLRDHL